LNERIDHYQARVTPAERPPFPGDRAVRALQSRRWRELAIHHRDRPTLDALLAWHHADHLFLDILTTDDGYPRKPDPAGFCALIKPTPCRAIACWRSATAISTCSGQGGGHRHLPL
jgi:phosphoglycolate phosphatase-like HAD superfamily hydrolase